MTNNLRKAMMIALGMLMLMPPYRLPMGLIPEQNMVVKDEIVYGVPKLEIPKEELPKEEIVKEEIIKEEIVKEEIPKEEIIEPIVDIPKVERKYTSVELTAYCSCKYCSSGTGVTASGVQASQGTIATPKVIPMGTSIIINGEPYRAEDRGGSIIVNGNGTYIFDIWFPSHKQALDFGRVKARMYIEDGKYFIEY